jgi:hypothetical protein
LLLVIGGVLLFRFIKQRRAMIETKPLTAEERRRGRKSSEGDVMVLFIFICALMVLLALWLILPPLWQSDRESPD